MIWKFVDAMTGQDLTYHVVGGICQFKTSVYALKGLESDEPIVCKSMERLILVCHLYDQNLP